MTILRWEPPIYRPKEWVADLSGVGRYHIKPVKGLTRTRKFYELRLNGDLLDVFNTTEEAKEYAERRAIEAAESHP